MTHFIKTKILFTFLLLATGNIHAQAQSYSSSNLLPDGNRCDHIIRMMRQHGVNNSMQRATAQSMLHHSSYGTMMIPETELGDLQILQVSQMLHEDTSCGPRFAVVLQNQSTRSVENFHLTVVGLLGRIHSLSPNACVKVGKIDPGQAIEMTVTLPLEALAMGNRNGQIIGMQKLIVVIDSYDEFVETNEANNLKAYEMATLPTIAPAVVQEMPALDSSTLPEIDDLPTMTTPSSISPVTTTMNQAGSSIVGQVQPDPRQSATDPLQSALKIMGVES